MSEKYYELKVKCPDTLKNQELNALAMKDFECEGILDGGLEEVEIDNHLGEMSYCGGNLPDEYMGLLENIIESQSQTYYFSKKEKAFSFKSLLMDEQGVDKVELQEKVNEDWNNDWRKNFQKIELENFNFTIYPSWDESIDESKSYIKIYPGQGFGTGTHETTRMCLEILSELEHKDLNNVLDFGCGSGILGIAVQKLNQVSRCDYYDIDEAALENCVQNLVLNSTKNYEVFSPREKFKMKEQSYDLIFANILEHVLLEESNFIQNLKTKYLILSGILVSQKEGMRNFYEGLGFQLVTSLDLGDWSCLLFEKFQTLDN